MHQMAARAKVVFSEANKGGAAVRVVIVVIILPMRSFLSQVFHKLGVLKTRLAKMKVVEKLHNNKQIVLVFAFPHW